ncbi:MAG: LlaMI family restriction endonuclease [Patescibacteria group bacterium]
MGTEKKEQVIKRIVRLFNKNVKGKKPNTSSSNLGHDGKAGHWLENQMRITHNANNAPDLWGFEMKNHTTSKTTFGDWSADYYIFKDQKYFLKNKGTKNRDKFMEIFGAPNSKRNNRYAWSGKPTPKIGSYNEFGQKLIIDKQNNIIAVYSFKSDKRKNKKKIIPLTMRKDDLILAKWRAQIIALKVENKFNKSGWFKCIENTKTGVYSHIVFGGPINFKSWINGVKKGFIFFDSGMHVGNNRPYSNWRANNKYWDSLVIGKY